VLVHAVEVLRLGPVRDLTASELIV
jgi:hypothetical protein